MPPIFAVAGIPATFVGTAIGRHLPQSVLLIGFAVVMVVAGIRMLQDNGDTGTACKVGDALRDRPRLLHLRRAVLGTDLGTKRGATAEMG